MRAGLLLIASASLAACGVGDTGGGGGGDDDNPNGIVCSAAFRTQGSFQPGTPARPIDPETGEPIGGCWPVGVWTFTATPDPEGEAIDVDGDGDPDRCGEVPGTAAPTVEQSYSFRVDRTEDPESDGLVESYAYLGDSPDFVNVKVSQGGGGDCEGIMEFASADRKSWWLFNPTICTSSSCDPATNNIAGTGDFTLYFSPQDGL